MNSLIFLAATSGAVREWEDGGMIALKVVAVLVLVALYGFFVAAEFALVKVRGSQLDTLIDEGHSGARRAKHITQHLDAYLSACQLGITLASLGLGWLGEPVLARIVEPLLFRFGLESEAIVRGVSF